MTTNDIDAIRKLTDAATKGPWTPGEPGEVESRIEMYDLPIHSPSTDAENPDTPDQVALIRYYAAGFQYPHGDAKADAEFIAAARTLVPALCDEIERLREQVFAQKPVVEAAQAWAEAHEDNDLVLRIRRPSAHPAVAGLYNAVEQYRLMDLALTAARDEAAALNQEKQQ